MKTPLIGVLALWSAGCALSPIPRDIRERHTEAARLAAELEPVVQQGDVIFRLSSTSVAGNLVDFSRGVANLSESDFSHAVLVMRADETGVLLVDVTAYGVERRYLIDWLMDHSNNIVVKRLRPAYRHLIPEVVRELEIVVANDSLYDDSFTPDNDTYYCTELVDHIFRKVGKPLAERISLKELPQYNLFVAVCCMIGGINTDSEVVVAGNEKIGLFSSPMLETVIDLRPHSAAIATAGEPAVVASPVSKGKTATGTDRSLSNATVETARGEQGSHGVTLECCQH
jgi:hypothetical protein